MVRQRVQKSSERSSQPQESATAPVLTQRHSPSPHAQQDSDSQVIPQHQREATVLKIQAKYGTITPEGQERLTFLQAKMADETQRKLDVGDRVYQNMLNSSAGDVSVAPPERNTALPIQAKLTMGQPGDKYEQEADRVAAQVVKRIHAPVPQHSGHQPLQRQAVPEQELQTKPTLQLRGGGGGMIDPPDYETAISAPPDYETAINAPPPDYETSINQAKGGGQPMADSIREPMEQAFGADFKGVKVHTDAQSHQLNQSIQARAFTTGQHIFFRKEEYNPGSRGGQELLAHELTHVMQQNGAAVQRKSQKEIIGQTESNERAVQRRQSPADGNGSSPSPALAQKGAKIGQGSEAAKMYTSIDGSNYLSASQLKPISSHDALKVIQRRPTRNRQQVEQVERQEASIYVEPIKLPSAVDREPARYAS